MSLNLRRGLAAAAALTLGGALSLVTTQASADVTTLARVDNPFEGATAYVNPEWPRNAAAEPGGSPIANQPTAVWLDRIAAIDGRRTARMGLRAHLDAALAQGAATWSSRSSSTTCPAATAPRWRPTASWARRPRPVQDASTSTRSRRSSPTRRTPTCGSSASSRSTRCRTWSPTSAPRATATAECDDDAGQRRLRRGRRGTRWHKLGAIPNVYNYMDVGHHGWLGWDDNFGAVRRPVSTAGRDHRAGHRRRRARLHRQHRQLQRAGPSRTSASTDTVNGTAVRQSRWVDWNQLRRRAVVRAGAAQRAGPSRLPVQHRHAHRHLPQRLGRPGPARPAPAPTTSVDTYVDESAASTAASTSATGATRPAPASASGRRPPPPPASTPTSGSSRRASRTAPARRSRTTRARASTGCATRPTAATPATATTCPARCPTRRCRATGSRRSSSS